MHYALIFMNVECHCGNHSASAMPEPICNYIDIEIHKNKNSVAVVCTCVFKKGKGYQETRWKRKFKSTKKVVHIKAKRRNYAWLIYGRWIKEEMEEKLTKEWLGSRDELVPPERDPCISYQSLFEIMYVAFVESNMFFFFYWQLLASWFESLLISHII